MFIKDLHVNGCGKYLKMFSMDNAVVLGIVFFIIVTPNRYYLSFDEKRILEVFLVYINGISFFNKKIRCNLIEQFCRFSLVTRLLFLIVLIMALVSAVYAPLTRYALLEVSLFLGLLLISMTLFCVSVKNIVVFNNAFIAALTVSSVIYQANFFSLYLYAVIYKIPMHWPLPITGFANVRFFNQYHLWLFFLISYPLLGFTGMDYRLRNSLKIIAIGWAILLFYSASRGAVIAILSGLLITGLFLKQQASDFIRLNSWILFFGAIGAGFLFKLLPLMLGYEITSGWRPVQQLLNDTPRLYLWGLALDNIKMSPWLGIGPMHYAYFPDAVSSYSLRPSVCAHPHNSILQWAAEMGLPSTIILLSLMGRGLYLWVKQLGINSENSIVATNDRSLWVVLFCTVCSVFIYSLVDGVIVMPTSQILMAAIIGWMLGIYYQTNKTVVEVKDNLFVLVFLGIFLIVITFSVAPGLIPRALGEKNPSTREHTKIIEPRFWMQGHIPD